MYLEFEDFSNEFTMSSSRVIRIHVLCPVAYSGGEGGNTSPDALRGGAPEIQRLERETTENNEKSKKY